MKSLKDEQWWQQNNVSICDIAGHLFKIIKMVNFMCIVSYFKRLLQKPLLNMHSL